MRQKKGTRRSAEHSSLARLDDSLPTGQSRAAWSSFPPEGLARHLAT